MYLPIPQQPDCATAWREAVRAVDGRPGHTAYNVVIDIADPVIGADRQNPKIAVVEGFLSKSEKSVETIANTIFPQSLYFRYGAPAFFDVFKEKVLAKVRRNDRWSGYYFERMIQLPGASNNLPNPLWDV